ncbi:Acetyltransferase [Arthrobacter sp. 9AX]|nr:Acetyltransferase [Arthrobacter sp. 9AX]
MINQMRRAASRDGIGIGGARLVVRVVTKTIARLNARAHGISGRLPVGSQVAGLRGISIEPDFQAHGPVWIEAIHDYGEESFRPKITIGARFRASDRLHISAIGKVSIGDDCLVGSSVFIGDHAHGSYRVSPASDPRSAPASRPLGSQGDVHIGANCWIGDNVTIVGPVTIGDGAVVAANSVVTRDIPPMRIVAGVPARVVKAYQETSKSWVPANA